MQECVGSVQHLWLVEVAQAADDRCMRSHCSHQPMLSPL